MTGNWISIFSSNEILVNVLTLDIAFIAALSKTENPELRATLILLILPDLCTKNDRVTFPCQFFCLATLG
jgi:hypothetical protein